MTYPLTLLTLIIALTFAGSGCSKAKDSASDARENVVVTVNGTPIIEAEVGAKIQQMSGHVQEVSPEMKERALDEIIAQELLYQKGVKLGLDRDAKYRNAVRAMELRLTEFKRQEMARQVRNTQIAATVEVTNEDVKKYYDDHKDMISTALHLAAVRFPDEEQARAARERLKGGTPFETIARELNPHPFKGKTPPWDMGYLQWNQIPTEWVDAVYALKKGEVSGVLSSKRTAVFIVKVLDRKKNPDAGFGSMSAGIMNRLRDDRVMQEYDRYLGKLKSDAKIVKHEERRKAS